MSVRTKALIAIFIAALLWSSSATVPKLLFLRAPVFTVAFQRFAVAALIMTPFVIRTRKPKNYLQTLLPLGIFNSLNIICYYTGLSLTTANTASILGPTVPLIVAVLSFLMIGESVSKQKFTGIAVGLAGALCIILIPLFSGGSVKMGTFIGNLFLVGSNLSWSFYIMYSRKILSKENFSPLLSTAVNIYTVSICTGIAALLFHQPLINSAIIQPTYISLLLFASIGITLITFFLFQWGVAHVSAATASLKEYIQLVIGVGINTVVLHEVFSGAYVIGSILVIAGVIIATRDHFTKQNAALVLNQS